MRKQEVGVAPLELDDNEVIGKVLQNRGNSFEVLVPESHSPKVLKHIGTEDNKILVGLSPSLRNTFFVRRNGYVVITLEKLGPNGKLKGEITDIITDVRDWQKTLKDWPFEFGTWKQEDNSMDLPPSLSEEESEYESDVEDMYENNDGSEIRNEK